MAVNRSASMIPGIDPKVDYAFKYLFGQEANRTLLIELLNAVLHPVPGMEIREVEILNPFNDRQSLRDKLSILDIKARDGKGQLFNIEMQMFGRADFIRRFLYHGTRLYQQQLASGEKYGELKPAILIAFLNYVQFPDSDAYHLEFGLLEKRMHFPMTEDLSFHFLQLPRFSKAETELATELDKWLYFLRHAEKMNVDLLPAALQSAPLVQAMGVLNMLSQAEIDREAYEAAWKAQLDYNSYIRPQIEQAERIEEAERKGRKIGSINLYRVLNSLVGLPEPSEEEIQSWSIELLAEKTEILQRTIRSRNRADS